MFGSSQEGGYRGHLTGVAAEVAEDSLISRWLKGKRPFPKTGVPLGLLQSAGVNFDNNLLERYANKEKLPYLTPQTIVPFGLVMGGKTADSLVN